MQISIGELLNKKTNNIIDIRSQYEYNLGHIPNARYISSIELLMNTDRYLNKGEVYYIYCSSGNRSRSIVNKLNNKGYKTVNIIGGYNNYLLRG